MLGLDLNHLIGQTPGEENRNVHFRHFIQCLTGKKHFFRLILQFSSTQSHEQPFVWL